MAVVSIPTLKGYFQTGDKPTQAQFENLIDSVVDAAKGCITLPLGTTSYPLPEDTYITDIVFKGETIEAADVSVGITENGKEILDIESVDNNKGVFPVHYFCEVARTIYFDVPNFLTIKLYIK